QRRLLRLVAAAHQGPELLGEAWAITRSPARHLNITAVQNPPNRRSPLRPGARCRTVRVRTERVRGSEPAVRTFPKRTDCQPERQRAGNDGQALTEPTHWMASAKQFCYPGRVTRAPLSSSKSSRAGTAVISFDSTGSCPHL